MKKVLCSFVAAMFASLFFLTATGVCGGPGPLPKNKIKNTAVSKEIMNDIFNQMISDNMQNESEEIRGPAREYIKVTHVSLAKERTIYLVEGLQYPFFGARAAMYWLYEKTPYGYTLFEELGSNDKIKILKTSHNGFNDIMTYGITGGGTELISCKSVFNGQKYINAGCTEKPFKSFDDIR